MSSSIRSQQVFNIQELERIISATLRNVNADGLSTGINDVHIFHFFHAFPGMEAYVGAEYYHLMGEKLAQVEHTQHARAQITELQMYPRAPRQYPPWEEFAMDAQQLESARLGVCQSLFRFALVDGKVYAQQQHIEKSITQIYFLQLTSYQINKLQLKPNPDNCHITLVGPSIVYTIGADRVQCFIDEYPQRDEFQVQTGAVKTTFCEDWARYSRCVVVEVSSEAIDKFMLAFNTHFQTQVKQSPHVTFAVVPRDLFPLGE